MNAFSAIQSLRERYDDPQSTAARWASLGPYYAMFPISFARQVINDFSEPGDTVLDPFAGRGTSVFCASEAGRMGLGVEHNPLGWIYGSTKLQPAPLSLIKRRLIEVSALSETKLSEAELLPEFFHLCFAQNVRAFLLAARESLNWRKSAADRTLMAFLLTYLHGKIGENGQPQALSNQMRQTKALAPDYSIKWWRANGLTRPPSVEPVAFLTQRIDWRYERGAPDFKASSIKLGDCRQVLTRIRRPKKPAKLLLTSPPYCGVTSYYYDQWLRLWLLGESERPRISGEVWKGKHDSKEDYRALLKTAFKASRRVLSDDATIYVRTDARIVTRSISIEVLSEIFPDKHLDIVEAPFSKPTQTHLFGDRSPKPGEVDLILKP